MQRDAAHESQVHGHNDSAKPDAHPAYHPKLIQVSQDLRVGVQQVGRESDQNFVHDFLLVQNALLERTGHAGVGRHDNCADHCNLDLQETPICVDHQHKDQGVASDEEHRAVLDCGE